LLLAGTRGWKKFGKDLVFETRAEHRQMLAKGNRCRNGVLIRWVRANRGASCPRNRTERWRARMGRDIRTDQYRRVERGGMMAIQPETRAFLVYLQKHKDVRARLKADRDKTLLYAGHFFAPMWRELESFQRKNPGTIQILPDVLRKIPAPPGSRGTLKDHVDGLTAKVSPGDQLIIWKALSGIFASNAEGTVYFSVGSGVDSNTKVFPSTEISVLARNKNISIEARQMVEYYQRCVREKRVDMNAGFLPGEL
jgi:hypothetical protein